jgi:hypothetical protein
MALCKLRASATEVAARPMGLSCRMLSKGVADRTEKMPTYVLKCEGCNGHRPFLIHEGELPDPAAGKPIQKHCPVCRTTTNWTFAFPERREGRDRREGSDRRATTH